MKTMLRYLFPVGLILALLATVPALAFLILDLNGYEAEINTALEKRFGISHHFALTDWAAFFLIALPFLILIFYFLKLKRTSYPVSSTFLWKKSIEDLHVNRLLQWLRKNILLLLQLLIALTLIYAILGPRLHGLVGGGRHYILMIDNSASMSATDIAPNRLEWAKLEALKEIDAATDSDFGMVLAFNATAEIRQSFTANRSLLRAAVEGIKPTQCPTKLDEALSLAESLANPTRSTENESVKPDNPELGKERSYATAEGIDTQVHLYSDGRFLDVADFALTNLQMQLHVPERKENGSGDNVGITRFDVLRNEADPTKLQVFLRVNNFRSKPANVSISVDALAEGKRLIDTRQRSLAIPARQIIAAGEGVVAKDIPGEQTLELEIPNIAENADVVLHAKINNAKDSFPLDDEAWLVLGVVRKAKVLIVTPGNILLQYFFESPSTQKIADVTFIEPDQLKNQTAYIDPALSGVFDLVIFDRCAPASENDMPRAHTLFIGYPPPPWKVTGKADDPLLVEKVEFPQVRGWNDQHPVMRGIRGWHELELAEAIRIPKLPPKTPILLEGDRDLALLAALSRGAYTDLIMAFPLETLDGKWNTRWFLKPGFPLFMRNLLLAQGNVRDAGSEETIKPGQVKIIRPGGGVTEIKIKSPQGEITTLERGNRSDFSFGGAKEQGVYEITWKDQVRRFAVNLFDANESNIEPRDAIQIGAEKVTAEETRKQPRELWRWVLLLGFALVLGEWYVYNKRVSV